MSDGIDWAAVKERVQRSEEALRLAFERGPQQLDEVLIARSRTLSGRQQRQAAPQSSLQLLTFRLSAQLYGWPLTDLAGVRRFDRITSLPEAPPELLGAVSDRGKVLALLSLKRLLSEPCEGLESGGHAVILRGLEVACHVDELEGLVDIGLDRVKSLEGDSTQGSAVVGIGPGDLRILSAKNLAEHSYFQTLEDRI